MDYSSMSVGELRKEMRDKFPETRGSFAANATKDECLAILSGAESTDVVIEQWKVRVGAKPLEPGVHGDNPPSGSSHVDGIVSTDELTHFVSAISQLNPKVAAAFSQMIEESKVRQMAFDQSTCIVSSDGKVTICNVEVPVILDLSDDEVKATNPNVAYVPKVDPEFRFDIWNAERTCGAVKFQQTAEDLICLLLANKRIMLVGPPAVGKTSVIAQFCARVCWPMTRFNGNRDVTVQDFVGNYEAHNGCTEWVDGPLPRAMREGHVLVIDEVDHMPAECSSVLHSVLEPGGHLIITGKGGEVIEPHPNFRIVATANTAGFGDDSGLHPNAQVQDAAFLSRFDNVFRVTWLDADDERDLLMKISGINKQDATTIVKIAHDTRKAVDNMDMLYPITLRQTIGWAQTAQLRDLATGFALAVLNKIPQQDVTAVAEIAQRHLGNKFGGNIATE